MNRSGQIPSLDGIRAVAVILVFLSHAGLGDLIPGGLGVTVFFVLSGYLITTLMRKEYDASQTLDLKAFWLRRFLRLMPPLTLIVLLDLLLTQLGLVTGAYTATGVASILFYFGNYFVIAHDYQDVPAGLGVAWSLAVEEHFYLLYPALALWLLRSASRRVAATSIALLCGGILAWRYVLYFHGASAHYVEMASDTRMDAILFGCLLAFVGNPWLDRPLKLGRSGERLMGGACLGVLAFSLLYRDEMFRQTLRYTLQATALLPLLYLAVARPDTLSKRWLSLAPLQYIGRVSYTIYLAHYLVLFMVRQQWPSIPTGMLIALSAALTLAIAELMRRHVEQPILIWRARLHHRKPKFAVPGSRQA